MCSYNRCLIKIKHLPTPDQTIPPSSELLQACQTRFFLKISPAALNHLFFVIYPRERTFPIKFEFDTPVQQSTSPQSEVRNWLRFVNLYSHWLTERFSFFPPNRALKADVETIRAKSLGSVQETLSKTNEKNMKSGHQYLKV